VCEEVKEHSFIVFEGIKNNSLQKAFKEKKFKYKLNINICIVLHLYIYVALLAVHTNQKRVQCERPREKSAVLREWKEALGSPVNKVYYY